nr:MAG TPA: hypothetical protein [Caudoviricetes sp.]
MANRLPLCSACRQNSTAIDRKQEKPPPVLAIPEAAIEGQMLVGCLLLHFIGMEGICQ